jgi:hypothetical protein
VMMAEKKAVNWVVEWDEKMVEKTVEKKDF